ncbi:MAG TPA: glycosyltransferase family 87 protein [Bryobacteraceae bacterium]
MGKTSHSPQAANRNSYKRPCGLPRSVILAFLSKRLRDIPLAIAFLLALIFFIERGPYRALRYATTGDFGTVYAAARCWLHAANPYERANLKDELARAGAPASIQSDQDVNPSVYLPSALLLMTPLAWMPWTAANVAWCLLSLALWALALWKILARTSLSARAKWLAVAGALVFSPSYVGIYDGNPGVIVISLVTLAILSESRIARAILLGIALCFKPQIALCAICVLILWRRWRIVAVAIVLFAICLLAGTRDRSWWQSEQRNLAVSFEPGGQSDPSPRSPVAWQFLNAQTLVSYPVPDRTFANAIVWVLGAALTGVFLLGAKSRWQAVAFFSALTLLLTYHRYYDAQLLLLAIPFLVELWPRRITFAMVAVCLLVLAFPIQSVLARKLGFAATVPSLQQAVLLRNQPAAVLSLTFLFAFTRRKEE